MVDTLEEYRRCVFPVETVEHFEQRTDEPVRPDGNLPRALSGELSPPVIPAPDVSEGIVRVPSNEKVGVGRVSREDYITALEEWLPRQSRPKGG